MKTKTIKCPCGRKHIFELGDEDKIIHRIEEPEPPPEPKKKSFIESFFSDDGDDA